MKKSIHLLIIDPQNDFCDLPAAYLPSDPQRPGQRIQPQLPVPGAHNDMLRLAELIDRGGDGLSKISVTLDSHHRVGIERPAMWRDASGAPVQPFTEIKAADVRAGRFTTTRPSSLPRALAYLDALEAGGRYALMVWPAHCEIGSWGHNVHPDVRAAYNRWEEQNCQVVKKVGKGSNPWTEHYSAIMAEVPDPNDPATQLNRDLIDLSMASDLTLIAGEAGSHCVKATVEHLADNLPAASLEKLVLLTDCISPVSGFEQQYRDFLQAMKQRGVRLTSSVGVLKELLNNGEYTHY